MEGVTGRNQAWAERSYDTENPPALSHQSPTLKGVADTFFNSLSSQNKAELAVGTAVTVGFCCCKGVTCCCCAITKLAGGVLLILGAVFAIVGGVTMIEDISDISGPIMLGGGVVSCIIGGGCCAC